MREFFAVAASRAVVVNAVKVSLFVGTVLNLINQGARVYAHGFGAYDLRTGLLNFVVPYCVATYSATKVVLRDRAARRDTARGA